MKIKLWDRLNREMTDGEIEFKPEIVMLVVSQYNDHNGQELYVGAMIQREYDGMIQEVVWTDDCIGINIGFGNQFMTLREMADDRNRLEQWYLIGNIYQGVTKSDEEE